MVVYFVINIFPRQKSPTESTSSVSKLKAKVPLTRQLHRWRRSRQKEGLLVAHSFRINRRLRKSSKHGAEGRVDATKILPAIFSGRTFSRHKATRPHLLSSLLLFPLPAKAFTSPVPSILRVVRFHVPSTRSPSSRRRCPPQGSSIERGVESEWAACCFRGRDK